MLVLKKFKASLKDYCEKTELVGMGYISNGNIHPSERIFWFACLTLATAGSYILIREYQTSFEGTAISFVIENSGARDVTNFVSIGLCRITAFQPDPKLIEYVRSLGNGTRGEDDVIDFLINVLDWSSFLLDTLTYFCDMMVDCVDCVQCPRTGYRELAALVQPNCSDLIVHCSWNGVPFDCCKYFLPVSTSVGPCLVLNSLHTAIKNGPHWLKAEVGWEAGDGLMEFYLNDNFFLHLLNEEDVPSNVIYHNVYKIRLQKENEIQLYVQDMINDPAIRDISPKYRKCKFPDEIPSTSAYDYYSFSTCIVNCLKSLQFKKCGCNHFHLLVKSDDTIPSCDYDGLKCLVKNEIVFLPILQMKPWNAIGQRCECLPSCTEKEVVVFNECTGSKRNCVVSSELNQTERNISAKHHVSIRQTRAQETFRRQAIRTKLDVVVTLGGILGLFLGASIISVVELVYFVCIRIFYSTKE